MAFLLLASAEAIPPRPAKVNYGKVQNDIPRGHCLCCKGTYPLTAIASISTFASRGSFATCTHARAGGFCGKNFP
jgi:prepilin signal peptidase PulO-like enzyme (type II secretory pathway)